MKDLYLDKKLSPALCETMKQQENILMQNIGKIKEKIERTENNRIRKKLG